MRSSLDDFLARHEPLTQETSGWRFREHALPLRVAGYLGDDMPPLEYVTSARTVVFRDDEVLVMRNLDEAHVLPGGQRERDEALLETVRREVLEEAGWSLDVEGVLGFIHLRHLGQKPPGFPYLYPDFTQVVYLSEAVHHEPDAMMSDGYEVEARFHPVSEARRLNLTLAGKLFLDAAVQLKTGR